MKKILLPIALLSLLMIGVSNASSHKGEKEIVSELRDFIILVEATDRWVELTSEKGCGFISIGFALRQNRSQLLDQYGMTNRREPERDSEYAIFVINITRTNEGLILEGIEGTAWETLTINCPNNTCYQYIDQNGLVDKN